MKRAFFLICSLLSTTIVVQAASFQCPYKQRPKAPENEDQIYQEFYYGCGCGCGEDGVKKSPCEIPSND